MKKIFLIILFLFICTAARADLANGLVGWWKLNQNSSGTCAGASVLDSSGFGNTGTCTANPTWVAGHIGRGAMTFNGTSQFVTTTYTQTSVTGFTVAAWIKTATAVKQSVIFTDRGSGAGQSLTLSIGGTYPGSVGAAGDVAYGLDSNGIWIGQYSTATVNNNAWRHVVGTWSAPSGNAVATGQFVIYIDGALATSTANSVGAATSPLTGLGGAVIADSSAWGVFLAATLDDVRIYNRALSAAEVAQLYQASGNSEGFFLPNNR